MQRVAPYHHLMPRLVSAQGLNRAGAKLPPDEQPGDAWLFGYHSLLYDMFGSESKGAMPGAVPCRLHDWTRDWSSVRTLASGCSKRYVAPDDFRPIERFGFANIRPRPGGVVNGVAIPHGAKDWSALNWREAGYELVDVSAQVSPYVGSAPGARVYAYVDRAPDTAQAPISRAYLNMGIAGAALWDGIAAGFADDFLRSTPLPRQGVFEGYFLFLGSDGRSIWVLDEFARAQTCVLMLPVALFDPRPGDQPQAAEERRLQSAQRFARYDVRAGRARGNGEVVAALQALQRCLRAAGDPRAYAEHRSWIVRLGALTRLAGNRDALRQFTADPDPWVSLAAARLLDQGIPCRSTPPEKR